MRQKLSETYSFLYILLIFTPAHHTKTGWNPETFRGILEQIQIQIQNINIFLWMSDHMAQLESLI